MATKVTLNLDPTDKILLKRSLNKNGNGQKFFTHEVRRLSDHYIPLDSGKLRDSAVEITDKIIYVQPYAKIQWYGNPGNSNGEPLRGKLWVLRMWQDRKNEIVKSVAKFCGVKVK